MRDSYLEEVDIVESTQDYARELCKANHKALHWVSAKRQSAGRGRQGRSWLNSDDALLVSCSFNSHLPQKFFSFIPFVAGWSLYKSIFGANPAWELGFFLKWPNDLAVLKNQVYKKIAGVLSEATAGGKITVGWGVNLLNSPSAISESSSLGEEGIVFARKRLLATLMTVFSEELGVYERRPEERCGELVELLSRGPMSLMWGLMGRHREELVVAHGLSPSGALQICKSDGSTKEVFAGDFVLEMKSVAKF